MLNLNQHTKIQNEGLKINLTDIDVETTSKNKINRHQCNNEQSKLEWSTGGALEKIS